MIGFRADKRLRADFSWVLAGNILYSACQWGIVVALAKLGSPEKVGEYALGMAISAPIVLFANLQLRALLASDVEGRFSFSQYLTFRLVTLGAALLVVAGTAAWMHGDWRLRGVVALCGVAQAIELVSETYYGWMQTHERMDRISVSLMLKGPLSLAALCGAMYVTRSAVWAVAGLILGRLLILLAWDSRLGFAQAEAKRRGVSGSFVQPVEPVRLEWDQNAMWPLLRMALPLGFVSMLVALNGSIPRYFVEAHSGAAELGIFSAIASLLTAGSLVVAAFGQSIFLPIAHACVTANLTKFRGYVTLTALLGTVLGGAGVLVAALFGREILAHVFRPEYGERADILVRLMIAGTVAFVASGLGYVITAARSLGPQIPQLLASAIAGAATCAWSIPRHGLSGAADASLVGSLVQLAGAGVILWRIDRRLRGRAPASGQVLQRELQATVSTSTARA